MSTRTFGPAFSERLDGERLRTQIALIRDFMLDGQWRTLSEISQTLGFPEASVSSDLRHLRKVIHGSYRVERKRVERGGCFYGTNLYRVTKPDPILQAELFG